MGSQRAIKKQLMKFQKLDSKKAEHFFKKGRKTGTRITSMLGKLKIRSTS